LRGINYPAHYQKPAAGLCCPFGFCQRRIQSADITPAYISPVTYQNFTCQQLQMEAKGVSQRAAVASGQQDKARKNDTIKTTVGVVLFWPVLLFNEGDGAKANELANLKGQMRAIEQASVQKNCGFNFTQ
jgi:hypothetical protein